MSEATDAPAEKPAVAEVPIPAEFVDLLADGKTDCVYKWVKKAGVADDKPVNNDNVFVHYVGRLWGGERHGEQFDSSRDRGEPFKFELGKGSVIRGWDVGVATMTRGELAEIICRPSYAYKNRATGSIPANSTLCFEVELLDFQGEDISELTDKSVMKRTLKAGEGYEHPSEFSKVTMNIQGRVNGATEPFDRRETVEFVLGEGSLSEPLPIPVGLELALTKMKKNERAKITIKPQHAFGKAGLQCNGAQCVPPNATVEYDVLLSDFVREKDTWEMNADEKIAAARNFKDRANAAFAKSQYSVAATCYKHVIKLLENEDTGADSEQEKRAERSALRLSAHANLAQTFLNLHNDNDALLHANKALEIDAKHSKALFRKGVALLRLAEFEAAKTAFQNVLIVEPSNKVAQRELAACEARIKQQLNAEKKLYQNLFKNLANRQEDELDKIERERAEKAKIEREAEEAKKQKKREARGPGHEHEHGPGHGSDSDDSCCK